MILQVLIAHIFFTLDSAPYRNSGPVHTLRITGDERMPVGQLPAFSQKAVSAGSRHEVQARYVARVQIDAIRNPFPTIGVVAASAAFAIKKMTGNIGKEDFTIVGVFEFHQATFSTTVTK